MWGGGEKTCIVQDRYVHFTDIREHGISSFILYANHTDRKRVVYAIFCDFACFLRFACISLFSFYKSGYLQTCKSINLQTVHIFMDCL